LWKYHGAGPWFPEIALYGSTHPNADLGIHLTLTSEWKYYRWGPVSGRDKSPSLVNALSFLYASADSVARMAVLNEVEQELRSQIQRCIAFGLYPTHLDSHMGTCFLNKDYVRIYLKLAREFHLPCLLNREAFQFLTGVDISELITPEDVVLDKIFMAFPQDFKSGMADYYTKVIKSLQPGLSCILLHAAYDNDEMKAVTVDRPDYGAAWRQADFDFWSSDAAKKILAENNIHLIGWKEIKQKLFDKKQ